MPFFTDDVAVRRAREEKVFEVSARSEGLADDGTFEVLISAPSGLSPERAIVGALKIAATGDAFVDMTHNVTVDTPGTSLTPTSLKVADSTISPTTNAEKDGTYSGGTTNGSRVIPGGNKAAGSGSLTEYPARIVEPDNNLLITLTNKSGGVQDYSISLVITERE